LGEKVDDTVSLQSKSYMSLWLVQGRASPKPSLGLGGKLWRRSWTSYGEERKDCGSVVGGGKRIWVAGGAFGRGKHRAGTEPSRKVLRRKRNGKRVAV